MPFNPSRRVVLGLAVVFLLVGVGSAVAGTGVGAVLNLGQTNSVNAETKLNSTVNAAVLRLFNGSTGSSAAALAATNSGSGSAVAATNSGAGFGIRGFSAAGTGVAGRHTNATGAGAGVDGQTLSKSPGAAGVRGAATATDPDSSAAGVHGRVTDGGYGGYGVFGEHAGNGIGVYAKSDGPFGYGTYSTGGLYGGFFAGPAADATGSSGVYATGSSYGAQSYAEATTGTSYGLYADADSDSGGHGVYGRADAFTGANYGVRGEVFSPGGVGGYFQNSAAGTDATGVAGLAGGASFASVPAGYFAGGGEFVGGNGVVGVSARADGYGVLGVRGTGRYAGYFSGDTHVSGTLSKSAGSFRIDHLLDPANKYLSHSFVESPDMKNVYDGQVRLGDDGAATVELPGYFDALNRDARYQLTPIGGAAPSLHVAKEVQGNRFAIAGGKPGLKVSWQITGIRKDAYANAHRIKVEEDKPAGERGRSFAPDARAGAGDGSQTSGNVRRDAPRVAKGDRAVRRR